MSNNPWPFVTVALVSLGFLAKSMAQQDSQPNRYTPGSTGPAARIKLGGDVPPDTAPPTRADVELPRLTLSDAPAGKERETLSDSRWTPNPSLPTQNSNSFANRTAGSREPARLRSVVGNNGSSGSDAATFGSNTQPDSPPPFRPDARTDNGPPRDRMRRNGAPRSSRWDNGASRNGNLEARSFERTEVAGRKSFGMDGFGNPSNVSHETTPKVEPANRVTVLQEPSSRRAQDTPSFSPRTTRETGMMSDRPITVDLPRIPIGNASSSRGGFTANQSRKTETRVTGGSTNDLAPPERGSITSTIGRDSLFRSNPRRPEPSSTNAFGSNANKPNISRESNPDDGLPNPGSDEDLSVTTGRKLPLWSTMALFASLAANLFFGWIAWDTHSRYQDFVEEMSESDTRRERRTRRMREEPATRASSTLRTREQDEADFLRGGIEV